MLHAICNLGAGLMNNSCIAVPGSNGPLRVVVVGAGKRGLKHVKILQQCRAAKLVGVCDVDAAALAPFAGNVPIAADHASLLADIGADAAVLAVSHDSYLPVLGYFLERGVTCLKEKPLARTLDEARQIETILERTSGRLAIAAQRRHSDLLAATRAFMGERTRPPLAFEYVYTLGLPPGDQGWRSLRSVAGGGAVLDMGYHVIDFLCALLGVPQSVAAFHQPNDAVRTAGTESVENGATLLLQYPGGTSGTVIISRHLVPESERATFWFEDGALRYDGRKLVSVTPNGVRTLAVKQSSDELLHRQLHALIDLSGGVPGSSCSVGDGIESMKTIELCYESLEGGGIAHAPVAA